MKVVQGLLITLGAAAAALVLSAGPANAGGPDYDLNTGGNFGLLNGNQVVVPVNVLANVCGNGVGVLGVGLGSSGICANGIG
jgi:hypothetical protein